MNRPALALLLVLPLAACGGGGSDAPARTSAVATTGSPDAQVVTVKGYDSPTRFEPTEVDARVGKVTLTYASAEKIPHNLLFKDKGFDGTGSVFGGKSEDLVLTFDKPGTYDFYCSFHEGMNGRVVVS